MDAERWRRVEELYHATLERRPSERGAFLALAVLAQKGGLSLFTSGESFEVPHGEPNFSSLSANPPVFLRDGLQLCVAIAARRIFQLEGIGGVSRVAHLPR
jgi:hypothetical protein